MTVSHGEDLASTVVSDEDIHTLLGLWGKPWTAGKAMLADFDHTFIWENTTIHYASTWGIFSLEGSGQIVKLSGDERKTVNEILDKYVGQKSPPRCPFGGCDTEMVDSAEIPLRLLSKMPSSASAKREARDSHFPKRRFFP